MKILRKMALCMFMCLLCFTAGCGPEEAQPASDSTPREPMPSEPSPTEQETEKPPPAKPSPTDAPQDFNEDAIPETIQATITMEDGGVIVLELYPNLAPQSVRNFVYLARQGYYDGLKFHRIIKGFMIQGGCPDGNGMGNPGYSILGEFKSNNIDNDLSHTRGVVSMARRGDNPNSAGSQFFIVHGDSTFLDGDYAAFGKVTDGMDVVDKLAGTPVTDSNGTVSPPDMPVIKTITIDSEIRLHEPDKIR